MVTLFAPWKSPNTSAAGGCLTIGPAIPLPGKSGSHEEPHAQPALCWRRLESTVSPAMTWQTPCSSTSQPSRTWSFTASGAVSALALDNQEVGSLVQPSLSDFGCKDDQRKRAPLLTLDTSSPSSFVRLPEQHRCGRPPSSVQFHPT